ncbi:hypothetical protein KR018_010701, partial [Drosophila ironensis]
MSDLSEQELDRHFTSQMRVMGEVYINIDKPNLKVAKSWIQIFLQAPKPEKCARNCLMLLMYEQLKSCNELSTPFTDPDNLTRNLNDTLARYESDAKREESDKQNRRSVCAENESIIGSYGSGSSRYNSFEELRQTSDESCSSLGCSFRKFNDVLVQRSKEQDKQILYHLRHQMQEKKLDEKHLVAQSQQWKDRFPETVMHSINLLNDWAGGDYHVNFLASILEPLIKDEPQIRPQIEELDRYFEKVLGTMIDNACDRRENNVRTLYQQVVHKQMEVQRAKEKDMQRTEKALKQESKRLSALSEELQRREN